MILIFVIWWSISEKLSLKDFYSFNDVGLRKYVAQDQRKWNFHNIVMAILKMTNMAMLNFFQINDYDVC